MTGALKAKSKTGVGVEEATLLESDPRWKLAERAARSTALFRATQLRDMLLFIVRQTILNPEEPIHEFELAHQVLGRRHDFNPLDDNIVRVQMAHLRKKLDLYFSTEGKDEENVITVALGSYRPVFSPRSQPISPAPAVTETAAGQKKDLSAGGSAHGEALPSRASEAEPQAGPVSGRRKGIALAVAAALVILVLVGACLALWIRLAGTEQALTVARQSLSPWKSRPSVAELWANFFDTSHDTDVVVSDDSYLLIEQINKQSTPFYSYLNHTYIGQPEGKTQSPESRFIENMIVTKSLGNISEFKLAQRILSLDPPAKNVHLFGARQYMPALVKQNNVILIGGRISNPWVELFESRLNFVENIRFEGYGVTTVTNRAPAPGEQPLYTSTDSVGYCVVAFLPNQSRDEKVLLIEGTSAEATEAAGDFLSGEQFSAFRGMLHASSLPYFEVLLKTSQVRGTPLTVTIEAYRAYPALH
jgi:hypothetical protein